MLDPAALKPAYSRFLAPGKLLLTGHSHQAWPDAAYGGLLLAWEDAALLADHKWERAFAQSEQVRAFVAEELLCEAAQVALAPNTHELVSRFLSALPLRTRPKIVTTSGEFHSMRRQLDRLSEEGVEVVRVEAFPVETLAERLAEKVCDKTAALMVSTVLFETSAVVPDLSLACSAAHRFGAEVLLDAYHQFRALPWQEIDEQAFVTGGGYKYAQWGEGVCFLRVPTACELRPIYTGWFSDFSHLSCKAEGQVRYGSRPADRFAGSTYDPTSHYRAVAVIGEHERLGLTTSRLRELSLKQTSLLLTELSALDLRTPIHEGRGGFVSVRVANSDRVTLELHRRGIVVDARGDLVRLGPAPYVSDDELRHACAALREILS